METYPSIDEKNGGPPFAFEIENDYVGLGTVAHILKEIDGVTEVRMRRLFSKWEEIHIWFKYANHDCVVWEPFGDNSRYWIGPKNPEEKFDVREIENAFKRYRPPFHRAVIGDILSLRLFKRLVGRS